MADFCKACSEEMFGEDYQELAHICAPGEAVRALCENCGYIYVDYDGKKIPMEGGTEPQGTLRHSELPPTAPEA